MGRRTGILITLLTLLVAGFLGGWWVVASLQEQIHKRLEKGWVIPPLELYSQGLALEVDRHLPLAAIQQELQHRGLVNERDFSLADGENCQTQTGVPLREPPAHCLWLKKTEVGPVLIAWDQDEWIQQLWQGQPWQEVRELSLFPRLITQFYDGQPILRQQAPLSEIPLACLQGVTAIEDRDFLEHGGVSATGILRALVRNVRAGRWAEGGSTITQQLVKNFFLTAKKTLRRKLEEQVLAILLESQISKDQILEMYLNVIYMGQSGPYQVRGFGSAALSYFDKPIRDLTLPECAMLAALINNPGRYSPFAHPDAAKGRRELVLRKMQAADMIDDHERTAALATPLPSAPDADHRAYAPYYVMAALHEYGDLGLEVEEGARLFTNLDPELQSMANDAVTRQLPLISAKIKHPSKDPLQAALVTIDVDSGAVLSLIGGRDFKTTQFNRAQESRRQIGSIVKPFVYWSAVRDHDPLTSVSNESFEWKTGKQSWRPKNYEGTSGGSVPYFYGLAHSLNIPAARVGQMVGLPAIANTLSWAGVSELIPQLPSLTLGALELSPLEVAQAYTTLARVGDGKLISFIQRIEDLNGATLYTHTSSSSAPKLEPTPTAVLVGMLEQSFALGTAQSARAAGFSGPWAGKTGTTSDTKDAWFAGFSPRLLTVVWVGYDDNTTLGLTGATAALPIWIEAMKSTPTLFRASDFKWPDSVQVREVSAVAVREQFPNLHELPESMKLIFAK